MKHKLKFLDIGRSTYFHYRYGVVFRKKSSRVSAFYASSTLAISGIFFITAHFAIPAFKHINFQNAQSLSPNSMVLAESSPKQTILPDIKQEDQPLTALIKDKLSAYPKDQTWAVFMFDPTSGHVVNINSDHVFASASLYKLFLLESLESKIPYDRWSITRLPDGTTIKDCVETMLKSSDNPCAEVLGDYLGWPSIDEFNKKSGFTKTEISRFSGRQTTASDVGEFFTRLHKGQILSDKARRFVFDALYQQSNSQGIIAGCNDCRTATKFGELTGIIHEAGVVTHGGRSYILVVLSEGGSFKQISEITKAIETGE